MAETIETYIKKIIKTTFPAEKVILQTACKSGSDCLVTQLSDTYNTYNKEKNEYCIINSWWSW